MRCSVGMLWLEWGKVQGGWTYMSLPNNRYCCHIGRLLSTIRLLDFHTIILTLINNFLAIEFV